MADLSKVKPGDIIHLKPRTITAIRTGSDGFEFLTAGSDVWIRDIDIARIESPAKPRFAVGAHGTLLDGRYFEILAAIRESHDWVYWIRLHNSTGPVNAERNEQWLISNARP